MFFIKLKLILGKYVHIFQYLLNKNNHIHKKDKNENGCIERLLMSRNYIKLNHLRNHFFKNRSYIIIKDAKNNLVINRTRNAQELQNIRKCAKILICFTRFCVLSTSCTFSTCLRPDRFYISDSIDVPTVSVLSAVRQLAAFKVNLKNHLLVNMYKSNSISKITYFGKTSF